MILPVISNDKRLSQDVDEKATFYLKDLAYVSYFDDMCAINSDYEKVRIVFRLSL